MFVDAAPAKTTSAPKFEAPSILPFTSRRVPIVVIPAKAALPFLCKVVRPTVIPIPVVNKV